MKRTEATEIIKEIIDSCQGVDGHPITLIAPNTATPQTDGYQVVINLALNDETKRCIQQIAARHKFACQIGSLFRTKRSINKDEPDTCIIYKPKSPNKI